MRYIVDYSHVILALLYFFIYVIDHMRLCIIDWSRYKCHSKLLFLQVYQQWSQPVVSLHPLQSQLPLFTPSISIRHLKVSSIITRITALNFMFRVYSLKPLSWREG